MQNNEPPVAQRSARAEAADTSNFFGRLADGIARHKWLIVGIWLLALAGGGAMAGRVAGILEGGSGDLPGTSSARVSAEIARDFDSPFR
ncbi:MAG: hypothetical protein FJZ00_12100, partial [Candidatus Sericytochromatia bacterium]|nr:hypothetical protein [Candidatus Tanganyikabacteria bacterium]